MRHQIYFEPYSYKTETSVSQLKWHIENCDKRLQEIEELKQVIIEHKANISEYAKELLAMNYTLELEIKRYKQYQGNVNYYIHLYKVYDNGNKADLIDETYKGTERHKAIARFEELKKQHPGIKAIKDIEKGRWEK